MARNVIAGTLITVLVAAGTAAAADATAVWQIGGVDHDFRDLTHVSDLNTYTNMFPEDTQFVVGKSDPKKDFSSIHPGPFDAWGGRREHTFRISFEMAELTEGAYQLQVDLVDTHADAPPKLRVRVNGEQSDVALERGTGDITLMHPEKGRVRTLRFVFGADSLRRGTNTIELTTHRGSWLLYDALSLKRLTAAEQMPVEMTVVPSMFFVERDGGLGQEVKVSLSGLASRARPKVEVRSGVDLIVSAELPEATLGTSVGVILVDPTEKPRQLTISASVGKQSGGTSVTQMPQKKWRIYCAPSTHTDIGYTEVQDKVVELHNRNTDLALELAAEFPLYHWNLESSWAAQMWLRDRPFYLHRELYEAARQKRIGIESTYLNMLTGLCSDEELIRNLYYSARLHRQHGVPFVSHTLTDAPSHVWGLPSILAGAGIRYLSCGINSTRAPLLPKGKLHEKSPFWWEGPDGGRVLAWFTAGYSQARRIGLRDGVDRMRAAVEADLFRWQKRQDYPYDAILLHGAYSDNVAIGRTIAQSVTDYTKRYAYPKVILSANNDFFEYIEANFADKIPVVRGCGGSWWEDGAGSSAFETGVNRVAHQDIIAAEEVSAAAFGVAEAPQFPQAQFNRVWDNILLYDEHTWGAHNSLRDPTSDFVQRQWAIKAAYATDAADQIRRLLGRGLRRLASRVKAPDGSLLVFNPSGRARSSVVHADVPRGTVIMDKDGVLPQQVVREDVLENRTVAFVARDVPAVGYRTYRVGSDAGSLTAPPGRFEGQVLENDFYRVTFDQATGGIASIIDKKLGKELVDQHSKYKFGQFIYALGGDFTGKYWVEGPDVEKIEFTESTGGEIKAGANGPVFSSAKASAKLKRFRTIELETILYEHERRIDFVFRLNKEMTYDREAVYIAFPVAGANPKFRYEVGGGSVRPNEEHLPGGCRDWFAVQRWVTVNTDDAAVAWTPIDTPLITLCGLTPGKWLDQLEISNGTIFAYAMNNYWFTNYKAGQDGRFTLRYSLTSDGSVEPMAASLFGDSAVQPMRAVRLHAKRRNVDLPPARSFCRVAPENVAITTVKRADDGKGLIVRVREIAGKDTDAKIVTHIDGISKASRCDLVERVQGPLELADGQVSLKLKANSMATIRLE